MEIMKYKMRGFYGIDNIVEENMCCVVGGGLELEYSWILR
jgi:hypothetical protein